MIILPVITACAEQATAQQSPLKIGWSRFPGWYPMAIATGQGLFEQYNVPVESILYDEAPRKLADFQAGKLDGALLSLADALLLDGYRPDYGRIVMVTDTSNGADAIVAEPQVRTVADLRGQRIGAEIGTSSELLVRTMLANRGVGLSEVTISGLKPENTLSLIAEDVIDGGHTQEPYIGQARERDYNVIFSSAEVPGLIVNVLIMRKSVVEERPETVQAFINAWFEAVTYWQENPTEGNQIIAAAIGLPVDEISSQGLRLFGQAANTGAFIRSESLSSLYGSGEVNKQFLISTGVVSTAPDLDRLLEPSFIRD